MRTYRARIAVDDGTGQLLDAYGDLYGRVERTLFAETMAGATDQSASLTSVKSAYLKRFDITARQFNAIHRSLKGKVDSIKELRKLHITEGKHRIAAAQKVIDGLERRILRAPDNLDIDRLKHKLHQKRRRLATLRRRQQKRIDDHKVGRVRLCFGSRKLFNAQFHLEKSGFDSHEQWHQAWQASRRSQFFVLGSKDETAGCQGCVITRADGEHEFSIRLRLPDCIADQAGSPKWINLSFNLNYGKATVLDAIANPRAISYRFAKDDKGWQLFISTEAIAVSPVSHADSGVIGVDINGDHLALAEVDRHGNPIDRHRIPLCTHGKTSHQSKALTGDAVRQLMAIAAQKNKPIALENLEFSKKKAQLESASRHRSRQLSSFAYQAILQTIKSRARDRGIEVKPVNPAYTSVIGACKFQIRYGLSSHQAAACVIARRAMNLCEEPNRRDQGTCYLPVRNRQQPVWSFWRKVSRKTAAARLSSLILSQSSPPVTAKACDPATCCG